ncbi:transcriptional regulator, LacI family [Parafrankia sp. EAN1pec]|uniref:LacI family DNA-binding transcriptional regulator n=1 Tax=Parafrankia sp. (strain EAN1pec) TaxID=298653 RepID=UPI0000540EF9|nr:transcriptional regulator, LacI family [Frankia sp. EAN1pec]
MRSNRASIRDVAAAAGVSQTTVSHVLNRTEGARVAEETRERVLEAAQRLGYTPSRLARGLRLRRTNTVGLISDHIATTPHAGKIILGVQETTLKHGLIPMLFNTGGSAEAEQRAVKELVQRQVDGVLYARMYHSHVQLPPGLSGLPTVLLDARSDDTMPAVVPDEFGGGRAAVEELLQHGHTRIGFITNRDDIPATHGRLEGYRAALKDAGIRYDPRLVIAEESEATGGYIAAHALLTRRGRPSGLFCFNDRMAMGAYRAAAELGLEIPRDLSVVGFDNQEIIANGLHPGLTTVALPHYEMGCWAADTLLGLIESSQPRASEGFPQLMSCPLVRRASVSPPPHRVSRVSG